jgi:hypothetical protein
MSRMTEQDLSLLHTHLVVPIAVGDIIYGEQTVEDDVQYGLHEALSEIDPDSALLAIALSAKHIALQKASDMPMAGALSIEASKIIDDYGPEWLMNFRKGPLDEDTLRDTLKHVPEDLESLAELLEALQASLADETGSLSKLCRILSIQARAHMEIADFILSELDAADGESELMADMIPAPVPQADNIILFPIHLRH